MRIRILGAAAGGGLPQWNCRCANCQRARSGSPEVRPRTQSSVAVSADGQWWFLLNVSADVRGQLAAFAELWPPTGQLRGTPVAGCLLTDAEIDHASGLLQLREGCRFSIWSTALVKHWLHRQLPIGTVLGSFAERPWHELALEVPCELTLPDGRASGLSVVAFAAGREVPRFVSDAAGDAAEARIGLAVFDAATKGCLVYAPGIGAVSPRLLAAADGAQCVLIDGTFWSEEEPIEMGISTRSSNQMGHAPISGPHGTLMALGALAARHRAYVHINNTNPILDARSAQRREIEGLGVRVSEDGDEYTI